MGRRDFIEIIFDIRKEIPGFNKEELLEYTQWAIPKLYNALKNEEELEVKCDKELINKLNKERSKYRINKGMDHINVTYSELYDNFKKDNEMYIKVYLSVYFYDSIENNSWNNNVSDKYWNDIWIVTLRKTIKTERKNSNCANCGAIMQYNQRRDIFECEYCGNIKDNKSNSKWEIVDIELGN